MNQHGRTFPLRVASASARHPMWAIAAWILLIAACVLLSTIVGTRAATQVDLGVGESGRASSLLQDADLIEPAAEYVLIGPRTKGSADAAEREDAAGDVADALRDVSDVSAVGEPVTSDDGEQTLLPVTMSGDPVTASERVGSLRSVTAAVAADHPDLLIQQTGAASLGAGVNDQLDADFVTAEALTIPVTLLVLFIVFGAFVAAVVPLVLALTCVVGAIGLSALVSHVVPDSGTTANMILLIGMAVGVDYSLFYIKREREERRAGASRLSAIEKAAATSGHAILFSGAAVVVSLAGLYFVGDVAFMSLASAAIIVVAVAVVGSITVLPALLMLLSRFLDRPRVPLVWRLTNRKTDAPARFWPAVLRPSLARPAMTMILTCLALVALSLPALQLSLETQKPENLPKRIPAVAANDDLNDAFPQIGSSFSVAVRADAAEADDITAVLSDLSGAFSTGGAAPSQVRLSSDRRTSTTEIMTPSAPDSAAAQDELLRLRKTLIPASFRDVPSGEVVVGGQTAADYDYDHNMKDKLPFVVGFVLLFNVLVMTFTFRSLVIGLVTLLMNLLSTGAAFGVLVLVFQHDWANRVLGYTSTGSIISWVPLFLFVVLVGLSMDYHVFVLHRVLEGTRAGDPLRTAVSRGIVRSAGVVTGAALVMAAVFSVFATLSFPEFKQLAVGLGVAIVLDAVVIRGFLLPATLLVTGRWTWWPGPLSRRVQAPAAASTTDADRVQETVSSDRA